MNFFAHVTLLLILLCHCANSAYNDYYSVVFAFKSVEELINGSETKGNGRRTLPGLTVWQYNGNDAEQPGPQDSLRCVAVTGKFDIGKTMFLRKFSKKIDGIDRNLPSGKNVSTVGLSVFYVQEPNGDWTAFIDVAGTGFKGRGEAASMAALSDNILKDTVIYLGCQVILLVDRVSAESFKEIEDLQARIRDVVWLKHSEIWSKKRPLPKSPDPVDEDLFVLLNSRNAEQVIDLASDVTYFASEPQALDMHCPVTTSTLPAEEQPLGVQLKNSLYSVNYSEREVRTHRFVWSRMGSPIGNVINELPLCMMPQKLKLLHALEYGRFEDQLIAAFQWSLQRYIRDVTVTLNLQQTVTDPELVGKCLVMFKGAQSSNPFGYTVKAAARALSQALYNFFGTSQPVNSDICHKYKYTISVSKTAGSIRYVEWVPEVLMHTGASSLELEWYVFKVIAPGCRLGSNAKIYDSPAHERITGSEISFECTRERKFDGDPGGTAIVKPNVPARVKPCPALHEEHAGEVFLIFATKCNEVATTICQQFGWGCSALYLQWITIIIAISSIVLFEFALPVVYDRWGMGVPRLRARLSIPVLVILLLSYAFEIVSLHLWFEAFCAMFSQKVIGELAKKGSEILVMLVQ